MSSQLNSTPQHLVIRELILAHAPHDGDFVTAVPGLTLFRRSAPTDPVAAEYKPSLALIAQGAKRVVLGTEHFDYGDSEYLLTSIGLPVISSVTEASVMRPYLCFVLAIDMLQIGTISAQLGADRPLRRLSRRGIGVGELPAALLDASVRLLGLLSTPQAIPVLAPLLQKEIIYHLLTGAQGACLMQMAAAESQTHQIGRAMEWLRTHYAAPLRMDELAARVNMSVSSLHHHFKAITAMTPMQYQKLQRLQSARQLMLIDMLDAGAAGHRVGYESASQFSREYTRHYGQAPMRDIAQARTQLLGVTAPA